MKKAIGTALGDRVCGSFYLIGKTLPRKSVKASFLNVSSKNVCPGKHFFLKY